MTVELIAAIFLAIVLPLVGLAYSNLKGRIDRLEKECKESLTDLNRNLRHRVDNINERMLQSVQNDRRDSIDKMVKSMEMLYAMLTRQGTEQVLERRRNAACPLDDK